MKLSIAFNRSRRGSRGRRMLRHLDDAAIAEAMVQSRDPKHNFKFLSRSAKFGLALRQALAERDGGK